MKTTSFVEWVYTVLQRSGKKACGWTAKCMESVIIYLQFLTQSLQFKWQILEEEQWRSKKWKTANYMVDLLSTIKLEVLDLRVKIKHISMLSLVAKPAIV